MKTEYVQIFETVLEIAKNIRKRTCEEVDVPVGVGMFIDVGSLQCNVSVWQRCSIHRFVNGLLPVRNGRENND